MSDIRKETRNESYKEILPTIKNRQEICLDVLRELGGEGTANEVAYRMFEKGIVPHYNTNFSNPRLNELVKDGKIEVLDKKVDRISGKKCTVYKIKGVY